MDQKKSLLEVSILYLIIMALFILGEEVLRFVIPPSLTYERKMLFLISTQLLLVFLPTIIFVFYKKYNLKDLRFNKLSLINFIICSAIMLFSIPITGFLNFLWMIFISHFGKLHAATVFMANNTIELLINLFVIAIVPALFEELLFRGVIFRGAEKLGRIGSIVLTALLFGLLHRDLQTLVGTVLLGIIITYMVYKTDSIYAGILAHFINNGFVVGLTYIVSKISPVAIGTMDKSNILDYSSQQILMMIIVFGVISFIAGVFLTGLLILLNYTTKKIKGEETQLDINPVNKKFLYPLVISLMLVVYSYYKQLI